MNDPTLLQGDLASLQDWCSKWLLSLHPDKCKYMAIGKPANTDYNLVAHGITTGIESVECVKYIGIVADSKLEFDRHISEKINKANRIMGIIRRTFQTLDEKFLSSLYKSMVRCHLDYTSSVWSPFKLKYIDALENVQRRAIDSCPA